MPTITKKELVYRIASKTNQKKVVAKRIIQYFIDEVVNELEKGNRLEFREFGVFEIKERAPRVARNPRTGAVVEVAAKKIVHFKPGRLMKERVCEPAPTRPTRTRDWTGQPAAAGQGFGRGQAYRSAGSYHEAET